MAYDYPRRDIPGISLRFDVNFALICTDGPENESPDEAHVARGRSGPGKIYLDSGATCHICHQRNWLNNIVKIPARQIRLGDGTSLAVREKGNLRLYMESTKTFVIFTNVLLVEKFNLTLISVGQLASAEGTMLVSGERHRRYVQGRL